MFIDFIIYCTDNNNTVLTKLMLIANIDECSTTAKSQADEFQAGKFICQI